MTLALPNTILDGQDAIATPVQQNFDTTVAYINSDLLARDGSVAMTGALMLLDGNPAASTADVEAASEAGSPVGMVGIWLTAVAPAKHVFLHGQDVSRSTYAELFALWGTTFGTGNGTTTFGLPDFRSRYPWGMESGQSTNDFIGEKFGVRNSIVVAHTHTVDVDHDHPEFVSSNGGVDHHHASASDASMYFYDNDGTGGSVAAGAITMKWVQATTIMSGTASAFEHTHPINIPALGATLKTSSGASDAVSSVNANLPPSIAVHFAVRALP